MRKYLLLLLIGVFVVQSIGAQDYPKRDDPYVNDLAKVLSPPEEDTLRAMISSVAPEFEIAVLTIDHIADYDPDATLESFSTRVFNVWGMNTRAVLIVLAVEDHQVRIELGIGYGMRYNDTAESVINEWMLQRFKDGDYMDGLAAGARHIYRDITGKYLGGFVERMGETYFSLRAAASQLLPSVP